MLQIIIYNPVFSQGKVILKELLKKLPSGLLDLLRVSGVVPKKVKLPYEKFKINDIAGLEKAASEGNPNIKKN